MRISSEPHPGVRTRVTITADKTSSEKSPPGLNLILNWYTLLDLPSEYEG